MTLTLEEIAKLSGGKLEGDPDTKITGAASLAEATVHEISFFNNPRYLAQLRKTRALPLSLCRLISPNKSEQPSFDAKPGKSIRAGCHQVRAAADKIRAGNSSQRSHSPAGENGRSHFHSTVGGDRSAARVSDHARSSAPAVTSGTMSSIGDGCMIYPRVVTIRERCRLRGPSNFAQRRA